MEERVKILVKRDLELSQINERLQKDNTIKSEFISKAIHKLRTPLTGIKWAIQTLFDEGKDTFGIEQKNLIKEMLNAINNLAALFNNLLDLERLEKGRLTFDIKKADLISVVKEAVEHLRLKTSKKAIEVELEITETNFPLIPFDAESINMVLDVLLDNAFKFSLSGDKITVSVELVNNEAVVGVKDTGIGIPENEMPRVFTNFFRGKNTKDIRAGGTGIELSLARNIIEQHNGRIWFKSEENKGSKFSFALPI